MGFVWQGPCILAGGDSLLLRFFRDTVASTQILRDVYSDFWGSPGPPEEAYLVFGSPCPTDCEEFSAGFRASFSRFLCVKIHMCAVPSSVAIELDRIGEGAFICFVHFLDDQIRVRASLRVTQIFFNLGWSFCLFCVAGVVLFDIRWVRPQSDLLRFFLIRGRRFGCFLGLPNAFLTLSGVAVGQCLPSCGHGDVPF